MLYVVELWLGDGWGWCMGGWHVGNGAPWVLVVVVVRGVWRVAGGVWALASS